MIKRYIYDTSCFFWCFSRGWAERDKFKNLGPILKIIFQAFWNGRNPNQRAGKSSGITTGVCSGVFIRTILRPFFGWRSRCRPDREKPAGTLPGVAIIFVFSLNSMLERDRFLRHCPFPMTGDRYIVLVPQPAMLLNTKLVRLTDKLHMMIKATCSMEGCSDERLLSLL